jgi:membrane protein
MWSKVIKEAAKNWSLHKDARQGAAGVLLRLFARPDRRVIAIAVAGLLFGRKAVTSQLRPQTINRFL